MLGLLHHTHKQTHTWHKHPVAGVPPTTILLNRFASNCAWKFGGRRPSFCNPSHLLYRPGRLWLGQSGAESKSWTRLFISPLYRGLKQETRVTTHPTGCSVLRDTRIPIYQPLTEPHTRRQIQFQLRQYAKHRIKKKSQPTGSSRQQIGAKDFGNIALHSGKAPPSLLFVLSLWVWTSTSCPVHVNTVIGLNLDSILRFLLSRCVFLFCPSFDKILGNRETRAHRSMSGLVCKCLCDCLSVCVCMYPCLFGLPEFPCIRQIVGIILVLDLHLSCRFFHAVVVFTSEFSAAVIHSEDLVQKALFWALWRHILNWSCHDMTATVHFIVSPPYSLSLWEHTTDI